MQGLTEAAGATLEKYTFPGNVRELEHLVDRAAVQAAGRAITVQEIEAQLAKSPATLPEMSLETLLALPFHDAIAFLEKALLQNALRHAEDNKSEAARRLGIHRRLLYEKLQQYRLV